MKVSDDRLYGSLVAAAGDRKIFGLSEDSIRRLAKNHALPLRRVTPLATPGALETELITWLKNQPLIGPVRHKRRLRKSRTGAKR